MDKLLGMQTFVAVVDHGSLTAGARALGRSLPAVVRTLAALESLLGVRLLVRTTRRMSLSEEGEVYLDRCRRILADVNEAEAALGARHAEPQGRLRVTAPVLFGQRHVAPAVTDFLRSHEQVSVELLLLDRNINLVEEGLDLAVRIGPLADSNLVAVSVSSVRRVICASPAFLSARGHPASPQALSEQPGVGFGGVRRASHLRWHDAGRERTVQLVSAFTCNHVLPSVQACVAGMGFGQFLSYQVEQQVRAGELEVVLVEFEPPPLPVSLVYTDARLMSARLRALVDWLKPRLAQRSELD